MYSVVLSLLLDCFDFRFVFPFDLSTPEVLLNFCYCTVRYCTVLNSWSRVLLSKSTPCVIGMRGENGKTLKNRGYARVEVSLFFQLSVFSSTFFCPPSTFSRDVNKKSIAPLASHECFFERDSFLLESRDKGKKDERCLFPSQVPLETSRDTCVSPSSTCRDRHEEGHQVFELSPNSFLSCLIVFDVSEVMT